MRAPRLAFGVGLAGLVVLVAVALACTFRPASSPASGSIALATASPSKALSSTAPSSPPAVTGSNVAPSASAAARATPSPAPVTLVGAGDIATCGSDADSRTAALLASIPGTVFTAGDNAYESGAGQEFVRCYGPTWGSVRDRTLPAPGNHDYGTPGAAGYLAYFGTAARPHGTTWYSVDLSAWHVIVLDSDCAEVGGCDASSPQGRWLAADLATNASARCTLAIWHHPRFSSGQHGDDPRTDPFWRLLAAAGADVIVNGHDHDYERFAPQSPTGTADPAHGIMEFVVGTGGAGLRPFATIRGNSLVRDSATHGVLDLTLAPDSFQWRFVPADGTFTDQGSAACH